MAIELAIAVRFGAGIRCRNVLHLLAWLVHRAFGEGVWLEPNGNHFWSIGRQCFVLFFGPIHRIAG